MQVTFLLQEIIWELSKKSADSFICQSKELKYSNQRYLTVLNRKKRNLFHYVKTRWVERHDSVFSFKDILKPILLSSLKIEEGSSDSAPKAHAPSSSISQFQFLVNLYVLSRGLSTTHNLSERHKNPIDLSQVMANVTSVLDMLSKQRVNANDNFKTLYAQVKEIAAKFDIKEIPRVCRLQTARNNDPYSTEEEY
ncbi:hypothetical protein AVEN_64089-1 [Araneus ventricosus]|uniref:Uncharacterized protein n=1 Tax=Araneus ventricosus TaxID=182803 RepID=A0A4Y2ALY6_ARAVE|nr:hypothetical protein AVEN_210-1 [Araneus ventricosus]GBL80694.1 hypothetical protein AVEN_111155-1 [Araneus ventricosus]GBL80707.1 hypothetical protein AVEN_253821-1 [Araneus ventricosus]GBL80720.1 hypothetical protein AVEN_64089-1 [Araneus ventricosus]